MAEESVMHIDTESPPTLSLTATTLSLPVRQLHGREALNQPYHFAIDLLGPVPAMEPEQWLQQPAFLALTAHSGIHGIIHSASLHYEGRQPMGYRLQLAPRLLNLEHPRRRRIWQQLSVPQVLRRLLQEHQLPDASYRFELPHGEYAPRELCVQYDESDLQLLQRLCEEEGIHFHFEHHRQQHVLVFAEDNASFAQPLLDAAFDRLGGEQPAIRQMVETLGRPLSEPRNAWHPPGNPAPANLGEAANQLHCTPATPGARPGSAQLRQNQLSRRELQRLRCLERQIDGCSTQADMGAGRILQVSGHPQASLNDQWLLCEVEHHFQAVGNLPTPSYHNDFKAIAWSTEFRPALTLAKPRIDGLQIGRVIEPARLDAHHRLQVQLWSAHAAEQEVQGVWLPIAHTGAGQPSLPMGGSEVHISFLDGDPDRPLLLAPGAPPLLGETDTPISLAANGNRLHIGANSISLSGPMLACAPQSPAEPAVTQQTASEEQPWNGEIYLFEQPPASTDCLGYTPWTIVRLPAPGIAALTSPEQQEVLLQGSSSSSGGLALSTQQKTRLAGEFARTPEQLFLVYRQQCVALAEYLRQHWDSQQRLAFIECARAAEQHRRCTRNHLLFDWLVPPFGRDA